MKEIIFGSRIIKLNFIEKELASKKKIFGEFDCDNNTLTLDKTLNDIKKTRQELIDEYKTMMQTQDSNGQQTPLHFRPIEPISFGHNVKFLRTNTITNLKRPRFEDTLHILMKNKTFYSENKH